jgi:3',5'-cyclic AMP phosphodiesterase CpdA
MVLPGGPSIRARLGRVVLCGILSLLPTPSAADELRLAVVGDTQPNFLSRKYPVFKKQIGQINALEPDVVVNLGDQIYGYGLFRTRREWGRYDALVKAVRAPYFRIPGNHDVFSRRSERTYIERYGRPFYSVDVKGFHLIFLDTMENGVWGKIGPIQLEWLKKDLDSRPGAATFVFTHVPVWFPNANHVRSIRREFWWREIHPLLAGRRVLGVFAGHFHRFGPNIRMGGIRYYITGGGGAGLTGVYARAGGSSHFLLVTAAEDGFDVQVVTPEGILGEGQADVVGRQAAPKPAR